MCRRLYLEFTFFLSALLCCFASLFTQFDQITPVATFYTLPLVNLICKRYINYLQSNLFTEIHRKVSMKEYQKGNDTLHATPNLLKQIYDTFEVGVKKVVIKLGRTPIQAMSISRVTQVDTL